jgi:hypothetical protein
LNGKRIDANYRPKLGDNCKVIWIYCARQAYFADVDLKVLDGGGLYLYLDRFNLPLDKYNRLKGDR